MRLVIVAPMAALIIMIAMLIVPGIAHGDSAVEPIPIYGYIYGSIQSDAASGSRALDGVVYVCQGDVIYYKLVTNTSGSYGYIFYLPAGIYTIYAQHQENGSIYESDHVKLTVTGFPYMQVAPTNLVCSINSPSSSPRPSVMPCADQYNTISGTVKTKDGKPYAGATVSLYQASDTGGLFHMQAGMVTRTDENGRFELDRVRVTGDDGLEVESRKDVYVMIDYIDGNGTQRSIRTETRTLYYPDTLIGLFDLASPQHNITFGDSDGVIYLPDSIDGWVSITSDPDGASIYVDGHQLTGSDGRPMATPCTIYLGSGRHEITMSMSGYADKSAMIDIGQGKQHDPVSMTLDKQAIPLKIILVMAAIILLAVLVTLLVAALLLIALIIWKRHAIKKALVALIKGLK
jgi:hypothetical protein